MLDVMTSLVMLLAAAASAIGGRCSSFACLLALHKAVSCLAELTAEACGLCASEALVLALLLLAMLLLPSATAAAAAAVAELN
jgi:hypothetical protein